MEQLRLDMLHPMRQAAVDRSTNLNLLLTVVVVVSLIILVLAVTYKFSQDKEIFVAERED